tara:strand:+ start:83 stop:904 length:822 start_codon:yes stop_codon:yes gene_type:complete
MSSNNNSGCGCSGMVILASFFIGYLVAKDSPGIEFWEQFIGVTVLASLGLSVIALFLTRITGIASQSSGSHWGRKPQPWDKVPESPADLHIQYKNFRGETKSFHGWSSTIGITGNHMNIVVMPEKKRIALNLDRILKQEKLNQQADQKPDKPEKQHEQGDNLQNFDTPKQDPDPKVMPEDKGADDEPKPAEEDHPENLKTTFNVIITGSGINTYKASKILQEHKPGAGHFDIYHILRNFPQTAFENLPQEQAELIKSQLEEAECEVELRPHGS